MQSVHPLDNSIIKESRKNRIILIILFTEQKGLVGLGQPRWNIEIKMFSFIVFDFGFHNKKNVPTLLKRGRGAVQVFLRVCNHTSFLPGYAFLKQNMILFITITFYFYNVFNFLTSTLKCAYKKHLKSL